MASSLPRAARWAAAFFGLLALRLGRDGRPQPGRLHPLRAEGAYQVIAGPSEVPLLVLEAVLRGALQLGHAGRRRKQLIREAGKSDIGGSVPEVEGQLWVISLFFDALTLKLRDLGHSGGQCGDVGCLRRLVPRGGLGGHLSGEN